MNQEPKQITELTEAELQSAFFSNAMQRQMIEANLSVLSGELIRRKQAASQPQPEASPIVLPKLKKITIPTTGSVTN